MCSLTYHACPENLSPILQEKGFVRFKKGYLNQGLPRPTAGLSGKKSARIFYPFYFWSRCTKQLAQLPVFQSHLKIWVPWISRVYRGSPLMQWQTYRKGLCITCHGNKFPLMLEKDPQWHEVLKGEEWESIPRARNTKQLTGPQGCSEGLARVPSKLLIVTTSLWIGPSTTKWPKTGWREPNYSS